MIDKLTWFKFDPSKWFMGRISRQQQSVQADFLRLCCVYWSKECNMSLDDAETEIPESIEQLVKTKIIKVVDENVFIDFLDEQIQKIEGKSKSRSEAAIRRWQIAKQKAEAEAKAMQTDANAMQNNTVALQVYESAMQTDADKIREDKRREEEEEKRKDGVEIEKQPADCYSPQFEPPPPPPKPSLSDAQREYLEKNVADKSYLPQAIRIAEWANQALNDSFFLDQLSVVCGNPKKAKELLPEKAFESIGNKKTYKHETDFRNHIMSVARILKNNGKL